MWGINATGTSLSRSEPGFETSKVVPRFDFYPHLAFPFTSTAGRCAP